jgi:hypothetical protein
MDYEFEVEYNQNPPGYATTTLGLNRNYMGTRKAIIPVVPIPAVYNLPMLHAFPAPWEAFPIIVDSMPNIETGRRGQNIAAAGWNPDVNGRNNGVVRIPRQHYIGWTATSVPERYAIYARLDGEWIQRSRQTAVRNAARAHYQQLAGML